jgi:hypothetical protein
MDSAVGVIRPEYALYPPTPAHKKHPTARSNPKPSRSNQALGDQAGEVEPLASDDEDIIVTHNLAWGAHPDWFARERNSELDLHDDALGKTVLPRRPQSQTPEINPAADEDLDISENLSQALSISASDAGHDASREPHDGAASNVQGREVLTLFRVASGIWGAGEIDDDGEDWESEPDGWNA